ncbi:Peptide deformylase [Serratia symbiotica]|nr:Peptide deformylase [Serratia symbiotica]
MSILKILHFPDNRLRKIAKPVKKINKNIQNIIQDMFDTMYSKEGIGLAATQVNIHQCIIVIDISENHQNNLVLINPKILKSSGQISIEEGCLSIPQERIIVPRAANIQIQTFDINGKCFQLEAKNLLSICIQHEMDHLIGKLFIDYLSPLKRNRIHKKFKKIIKFNKKN